MMTGGQKHFNKQPLRRDIPENSLVNSLKLDNPVARPLPIEIIWRVTSATLFLMLHLSNCLDHLPHPTAEKVIAFTDMVG